MRHAQLVGKKDMTTIVKAFAAIPLPLQIGIVWCLGALLAALT